ncbi:hypothetical protein LWI29_023747 [Acer saccharum]|uniref:Uncharacterized protein n=1 Tax=Acer saccharum TaxID=4024 RepID=A0AA39SMT8_ACESA|nr:hypothetical protein LWI29_023747 [Acer saccharum]
MEEGSSSTSTSDPPQQKTTLSTDQFSAQEPRAVTGVNLGLKSSNLLEDVPPVAGEQVPSPIVAGAQVVVVAEQVPLPVAAAIAVPRVVAGVNLGLKMEEGSSSTSGPPPLKQQKTTLSTDQVSAQEPRAVAGVNLGLKMKMEEGSSSTSGPTLKQQKTTLSPGVNLEDPPPVAEQVFEIEDNSEGEYRCAKMKMKMKMEEGSSSTSGPPLKQQKPRAVAGVNLGLKMKMEEGSSSTSGPTLKQQNTTLSIEQVPAQEPGVNLEDPPPVAEQVFEIEDNSEWEYRWAKMKQIEDGRARNLAEHFRSFRRRRFTGLPALSSQRDLLHFHIATSLNHHVFCRNFAKKCHGGRLFQILHEEWLQYRVPKAVDAEDIVLAAVPTLPQAPFPKVTPLASVVVPQAPWVVARDFYVYLESFNIRYSGAGSDRTLRDLIHFHLEMSQDPRSFCESLAVEISVVGDRQIFYDRLQRLLWEEFEAYGAYLAAGHPIIAEETFFAFGDKVSLFILAIQKTVILSCSLPAGQQVTHRYMRDVNKAVKELAKIFLEKTDLNIMLLSTEDLIEITLKVLGPEIPGFIMENFPYLMQPGRGSDEKQNEIGKP